MVDWSYYNKYEHVEDRFLPFKGQGTTMATQLVTAVTKLVYMYYNNGDYYDNVNSPLSGGGNDLSSYANWLSANIPAARDILPGIADCYNDDDYEDLLRELTDATFDMEDLDNLDKVPAVGSIYRCEGPYEYSDGDEYDDEW